MRGWGGGRTRREKKKSGRGKGGGGGGGAREREWGRERGKERGQEEREREGERERDWGRGREGEGEREREGGGRGEVGEVLIESERYFCPIHMNKGPCRLLMPLGGGIRLPPAESSPRRGLSLFTLYPTRRGEVLAGWSQV